MNDLKISTFAQFRSAEDRKAFNRLVRKQVHVFEQICEKKETAIQCAIWTVLRDNPTLWYIGPCLEYRNDKPFHLTSPERLSAAIAGVLA
jgi:hypothetical protein